MSPWEIHENVAKEKAQCLAVLMTVRKTSQILKTLPGSAPKVNGVHSRPRPNLHPSLVEICEVVFSWNPADKPIRQPMDMGKNTTSFAEVIHRIFPVIQISRVILFL